MFNSSQREEPYLRLNPGRGLQRWGLHLVGPVTGAAWLSSARVVRCWVKSRNERNPCRMLPPGNAEHSYETAGDKPEEGGDDVKSSWPLRVGLQTCYNGCDSEQRCCKAKQISKSVAQFGLQAATRLHEAGIASNRRSAMLR